jgi:hypothetical protein
LTAARIRLMLIVPLRFNDLIFLICTFRFFADDIFISLPEQFIRDELRLKFPSHERAGQTCRS